MSDSGEGSDGGSDGGGRSSRHAAPGYGEMRGRRAAHGLARRLRGVPGEGIVSDPIIGVAGLWAIAFAPLGAAVAAALWSAARRK